MRAPAPGRPITHNGPRPGVARAFAPERRVATGLSGVNTEPEIPIAQIMDGFETSRVSARSEVSQVSELARRSAIDASEPEPVAPPKPRKTLARGSIGSAVRQLQRTLMKLGHLSADAFASGPGVFGPRTEQALRAFQLQSGLKPTGQLDALTELALMQAKRG